MPLFDSSTQARRQRSLILGVVCILLVFFAGLAQVTHVHLANNVSHADCALCATAHASYSGTATAEVVAVPMYRAFFRQSALPAPRRSFSAFPLSIRPPPALSIAS